MHTTNTMWTTRMRALALSFALLACCAGTIEAQDARQEQRPALAVLDLAAQQISLSTTGGAAFPNVGAKRHRTLVGAYPTDAGGGTTSNTEDPPPPPDDGGDPPPPPPGGGYDLDGDKGGDEGGTTSNTEDPPPPPDDGGDPPPPPPGGGYDRIEAGDDGYARSGLALAQEQPALGNYPNPFNPETTIRFALPEGQQVRLIVYNALGQAVQVLADGWHETGAHEARFAADNLPSGTYFVRLQTNAGVVTHSMVLAR